MRTECEPSAYILVFSKLVQKTTFDNSQLNEFHSTSCHLFGYTWLLSFCLAKGHTLFLTSSACWNANTGLPYKQGDHTPKQVPDERAYQSIHSVE
jgi:hypothetical protein